MRQLLRAGLPRVLVALVALVAAPASAEPSQFCRLGLGHARVDFCMAVSLYHNHSSAAHDLYLSLNVRRPFAPDDAAAPGLGWTAVGTGARMHGSLMFVVYGDPDARAAGKQAPPPVLSVRTVEKKHSRPVGIHAAKFDGGGGGAVDVRVLDAKWAPSAANDSHVAQLSAVCYGCSNWGGDAIAVEAASQPWIWAWNQDQDMSPYAEDVDLQRHELEEGGFGVFYVDMKSAATHHADDAVPSVQGTANVQTSEMPIEGKAPAGFLDSVRDRPLAHMHGLLMATAFLLLFPAGAVAIRSGSSGAFKHHWAVQASALLVALAGAATATFMTRGDLFGSPHQIAGSAISLLLPVQAALGWRHHIDFVRIRRRTPISYAHICLGFTLLVGGWVNVLGGMVLFGWGRPGVLLAGGLVAVEALGVGGWAVLAKRRQRAASLAAAKQAPDAAAAYFALDDMDSDDDEDDEGGRADEEHKGLMKKA
ncbi:hypothetical protein ESCO_006849 [Escovopsis weberi]|uniref:Cytochrome b561 domain-containing protein n=1 Tax=Escovopsis weberi TaxID=150374 RepID=A0A0M9VV87_ESCWE|nr:hypothetical protein ESCO_006849 [Escovopsis weberi]